MYMDDIEVFAKKWKRSWQKQKEYTGRIWELNLTLKNHPCSWCGKREDTK